MDGFCYFVVLKRTKAGTVGYLVYGVRILGLDGRPARLRSLMFRTLFAVLGPLAGIESVWIASDPHRQALRDKFAQTYVLRGKPCPLSKQPRQCYPDPSSWVSPTERASASTAG